MSLNQKGTGQGAVLIAGTATLAAPSGSIPGTDSRPARQGEYLIIYCIGLGQVTNQPASGFPARPDPLSQTPETPVVTIGGIPATVSFGGLAPGFVGLYQVNVQVPGNVPSGNEVPLVISLGAGRSNSVTIALQ